MYHILPFVDTVLKEKFGANQPVTPLFEVTECCEEEKETENLIQERLNNEPANTD